MVTTEQIGWIGLGLLSLYFLSQYSVAREEHRQYGDQLRGSLIGDTVSMMWTSFLILSRRTIALIFLGLSLLGITTGAFLSGFVGIFQFDPFVWAGISGAVLSFGSSFGVFDLDVFTVILFIVGAGMLALGVRTAAREVA